MISEELKKIIDLLCTQGNMNFLGGTTEYEIAAFELEHGVKFPAKYREWLLFF